MYTSTKDIRANVKTSWVHPNCKFQRGDRVVVNEYVLPQKPYGRNGDASRLIRERAGEEGHVVAVSCTDRGTIRGRSNNGYFERQFTRYYVQFADRTIIGFHSHYLNLIN